jgi:hypothetical protein
MTTLHDFGGVLGLPFGHFLLSSHNFMVTASSWLVCEVALSGRKATHPITILALDNLTTSSNGIRVKALGSSHPFTSNDKQC